MSKASDKIAAEEAANKAPLVVDTANGELHNELQSIALALANSGAAVDIVVQEQIRRLQTLCYGHLTERDRPAFIEGTTTPAPASPAGMADPAVVVVQP